MPQLRDSGNQYALHEYASDPDTQETRHAVKRGQTARYQGFDRIFGLETEYGISVTGTQVPIEASHAAMTMFQPVVSRARSTNTYLENGARLYLDVGSHPEYATAETRDPMDALAQDLAGEQVMRRLGQDAQRRLRTTYGENATLHLFKNNVDSAGHSFGCHENYLVRRFVPLQRIERELLPFLVTRQLFTGAGRITPEGFAISQRADYLEESVSSSTTRSRPMVNTRDEPHADPSEFRRLHVIIGDSNRSQFATMMKLATTHLVLCVIEEAARRGEPSGFEACALADPTAANQAVSRDLSCHSSRLALAAGEVAGDASGATETSGASPATDATALDLQWRYLRVVEAFVEARPQQDLRLPACDCGRVVEQWRGILESLDDGNVTPLADRVDWVAKHQLVQALRRRRPGVSFARLAQIDMDYHDVANGTVYDSLLARRAMRRLLPHDAVAYALAHPPQDTRAALRGAFVARALASGADFSCDWTHVSLASPQRLEALLLDPFEVTGNERYSCVMGAIVERLIH